ncbi:MAG TPA: acylphosphatase [Thermoplasmata archaeon]
MNVRAHVIFSGMVQGVFFRANTKNCADKYGLTGWVRNTSDGKVEALFEGEKASVEGAIEWCATRQPYARVESKQVEYSEFTGEFDGFFIAV